MKNDSCWFYSCLTAKSNAMVQNPIESCHHSKTAETKQHSDMELWNAISTAGKILILRFIFSPFCLYSFFSFFLVILLFNQLIGEIRELWKLLVYWLVQLYFDNNSALAVFGQLWLNFFVFFIKFLFGEASVIDSSVCKVDRYYFFLIHMRSCWIAFRILWNSKFILWDCHKSHWVPHCFGTHS